VGRGATGRLLSLRLLPGRKFEFPVLLRFTFARGTLALPVVLAFVWFAFAGRFALAGRLALPFILPLAFSFAFLGLGRLGLLSFDEFAFRLSFVFSGGVTISGDSPSLVGRLTSIATV